MKPLKSRTTVLVGVSGSFLAFAAPFALWADSTRDLYFAALGGVVFATFVGLPLFGAMAWVNMWPQRELDEDPMALDRRYRHIERNFACAGMLSAGYTAGWLLNCPLLHLDETPSQIQFVVSLVLLLASMLVMMVAAVTKIGLVKRLEILKDRIKAANTKSNSVSAT